MKGKATGSKCITGTQIDGTRRVGKIGERNVCLRLLFRITVFPGGNSSSRVSAGREGLLGDMLAGW